MFVCLQEAVAVARGTLLMRQNAGPSCVTATGVFVEWGTQNETCGPNMALLACNARGPQGGGG